MHPDDVADLVATEFADLEAELARRNDLPVARCRLRSGPRIEVEFTARQQASELVGAGIVVAREAGLQQQGVRVPLLGRAIERELVLAIGCENWDGTPPTAELFLPGGSALPDSEWPQDSSNRGIAIGHPKYKRKFFCRPGFREYHTHPVHADDPWDGHREGFSLASLIVGLLDDLSHRWTMAAT